jgi:hypothetical protein
MGLQFLTKGDGNWNQDDGISTVCLYPQAHKLYTYTNHWDRLFDAIRVQLLLDNIVVTIAPRCAGRCHALRTPKPTHHKLRLPIHHLIDPEYLNIPSER